MIRAEIRKQIELFLMNCDYEKADFDFLISTVKKTYADNKGKRTKRFDAYEILGVEQIDADNCEVVTDGSKPDFYSLYGHLKGEGVQCIGDFTTRAHALEVYNLIVGEDANRFPIN